MRPGGGQVAPLLPPPLASTRVYTNPLAEQPLPAVQVNVPTNDSRRPQGGQPGPAGVQNSTFKRLLIYVHGSTPGPPANFLATVRPGEVALVQYDPATCTLRQLIDSARAATGGGRVHSAGILAPVEEIAGVGVGLRLTGKEGDVTGLLSVATLQASWEMQELAREIGVLVQPWGRIHLLSGDVLPRGAAMVQAFRERACRTCSAGKGDALREEFRLSAEEADDIQPCARLYFKRSQLAAFLTALDSGGGGGSGHSAGGAAALVGDTPGGAQLLKMGEKLKGKVTDRDNVERAQTAGATVPFLYSVMMASFLSIFVPQKCPSGLTCTFEENVTDLKVFNRIVLAFNAAACLCLVAGQALYVQRENWMIRHLDTDESEPYDSLAVGAFREQFPHLAVSLDRHNRRCMVFSVLTLVVLGMNFVLSSVLVLHLYYDGTRTVTTLITNSLLVGLHIKNSYGICLSSWKQGLAVSTARSQPISYNVVDPEFADTAREDGKP